MGLMAFRPSANMRVRKPIRLAGHTPLTRDPGRYDSARDSTEYCACSHIPELTDIRVKKFNRQYGEGSSQDAADEDRAKLNPTHI